ncbi:hypothetical protein ACLMJK_005724 [Lecanora helva]
MEECILYSRFLALLLLFTTSLLPSYAIQPAKPPDTGFAEGYLGNLHPPPTGDYLIGTKCICERDQMAVMPDSEVEFGQYIQYDYYNYHMNRTLFFHLTCPQNHLDPSICLEGSEDEPIDPFYSLHSKDEKWVCRLWGADKVKNREFDEGAWATLCFWFDRYWDYDTTMKFNGQKRDIGYFGRQGRTETNKEEGRSICDGICRDYLGMPRKEDETDDFRYDNLTYLLYPIGLRAKAPADLTSTD